MTDQHPVRRLVPALTVLFLLAPLAEAKFSKRKALRSTKGTYNGAFTETLVTGGGGIFNVLNNAPARIRLRGPGKGPLSGAIRFSRFDNEPDVPVTGRVTKIKVKRKGKKFDIAGTWTFLFTAQGADGDATGDFRGTIRQKRVAGLSRRTELEMKIPISVTGINSGDPYTVNSRIKVTK